MDCHTKYMLPLGIVIFSIITLACFNMHFFARGALIVDTPELLERLHYMRTHLLAWQLLWLNWMFAALGLLLFACMLAQFCPPGFVRNFGLLLMALGIAPDITGECIYAFILPAVFNDGLLSNSALHVMEIVAMNLTGTVGNGFYNVGGLVLNSLLYVNPAVPRGIIAGGWPAWLVGIALSVATALGQYEYAEIFTAIAMLWSTLWILLVSLTLFRSPQRYQFND